MPKPQHRLERRSEKLAAALKDRLDLTTRSLTVQGRAPWTERLSQREALDFWKRHRYDEYGQAVLSRMSPEDIAELDLALNQLTQQEVLDGGMV